MKNTLLIFAGLILISTGCKRIDKLTQFEIEYSETVVIPASTGVNLPFNIITPDIETNSGQAFAVHDTRKDMIEKIILTNLKLSIASPPSGDFSFLKSISIYLSADGLTETLVAWRDNIPDNVGNVLTMLVTKTDLQEYIKKDKFSLRLHTVTDKLLASDHEIDIDAIFFVDAKVLGQ